MPATNTTTTITTTKQVGFPFDWVITSQQDNPANVCPTDSLILGTFAAVHAIAAVLSVIFGNRNVVQKLTFGILGKRRSTAWPYMWLINVGINLGANAIIAHLIRATPGYRTTISLVELMLFLTTRPRLGWLFMLGINSIPGEKLDYQYTSSGFACVFAEIILQGIGMYPMVLVAHFGAPRRYLAVWTAEYASLPPPPCALDVRCHDVLSRIWWVLACRIHGELPSASL